jgi:hypothetical protein
MSGRLERINGKAVLWRGRRWVAVRQESRYYVVDLTTGAEFGANGLSHAIKKAQDNDKRAGASC